MIRRDVENLLLSQMEYVPAIVLTGSRQVGKTTLAKALNVGRPTVYLDLESPSDRAKLSDTEGYLTSQLNSLLILDEVHRMPDLFPLLRGRIDEGRRQGIRGGMYILLGSASVALLDHSAESLAGRVSYVELHPLSAHELDRNSQLDFNKLWLRGGYPDSYLARSDEESFEWRTNLIHTYLMREVPLFSPRKSTEQMRRLWTMMAHLQGQVFNASMLARSMGTDYKTVQSYTGLLEQLLLVREVQPWHVNVGKRLTKRSKMYVRDSGILHALLGIRTMDELLSHPIAGASWEGFIIQQIASIARDRVQAHFYRTSGGAEVDVVLRFANGECWTVEVKRTSSPSIGRGYKEALTDIAPSRAFVVYNGVETYPLGGNVTAIPISALLHTIDSTAG